jgi:hypothetical protein
MAGRIPELSGGYICCHALILRNYIETRVSSDVAFRNSIPHVYTGELGHTILAVGEERKLYCHQAEKST